MPLVPDLVELITRRDDRPGRAPRGARRPRGRDRHPRLGRRPRADPKTETSGVHWILASTWVPYQLPTFVTPAFQGYTSGHSTFSRAAAEVMTAFTGSEYFPGGLGRWTNPGRASSTSRRARAATSSSSAATYYDAADQAGHLAAVRRDPHPGGRLQRPQDRLGVREGCVGARPAVLRRDGGS